MNKLYFGTDYDDIDDSPTDIPETDKSIKELEEEGQARFSDMIADKFAKLNHDLAELAKVLGQPF